MRGKGGCDEDMNVSFFVLFSIVSCFSLLFMSYAMRFMIMMFCYGSGWERERALAVDGFA